MINASVAGLTLPLYRAYLTKYVLPIHPNLVIVLINPFFSAAQFYRSHRKNEAPSAKKRMKATHMEFSASSLLHKIIKRSHVYPKIKQVFKSFLSNNFPKLLLKYQLLKSRQQIALEKEKLRIARPLDTITNAYLEIFSSRLRELISFLKKKHIEVIVGTYPTLMSRSNINTFQGIFNDNRRFIVEFSFLGMIEIQKKYNLTIGNVAANEGIPCIDLQTAIPKSTDFFADDVHYTDQGARLVAQAFTEQILKRYLWNKFTAGAH